MGLAGADAGLFQTCVGEPEMLTATDELLLGLAATLATADKATYAPIKPIVTNYNFIQCKSASVLYL